MWILLKQETVSGSGISWAICKSAPRSRQITMPAPHHSVFLQADSVLIPVLGSQPAGDASHKPGNRLPLLSARPAVTLATLKRAATNFVFGELRNDGCEQFAYDCYPTASRDCDLNPGPSAPESSTLTTRLPSDPVIMLVDRLT